MTEGRNSRSGWGARWIRTTPDDRHWLWCQHDRREHPHGPDAACRDGATADDGLPDAV